MTTTIHSPGRLRPDGLDETRCGLLASSLPGGRRGSISTHWRRVTCQSCLKRMLLGLRANVAAVATRLDELEA